MQIELWKIEHKKEQTMKGKKTKSGFMFSMRAL